MSEPAQRFATLVREETGNAIPASRLASLDALLAKRAAAHGRPVVQYLDDLAAGRLPAEWPAVVAEVTIKESSFFRAPQQFDAIVQQVLPALLPARTAQRRLRLWSVACAGGEEPATLALLCAESAALQGWDWSVLATDLDTDALERARRGLYGERAIAGVPEDLRRRWFTRRSTLYELAPALRERIDYRELNLTRSPWTLPEAAYDVLLARNVLIYFRRTLQRRVLGALAERMAADGFLFLGASETLWQAQGELAVCDFGGVFCYRHAPPAHSVPAPVPRRSSRAAPPPRAVTNPATPPSRSAARPATPHAVAPAVAPPAALPPLGRAIAAFAAQQFEDARTAIALAIAGTPQDAAAHAVSGLLHQVMGREVEAAADFRAALYLDPALFQVRVQLAEVMARQRETERAEQQWRAVLRDLDNGTARALSGGEGLPWVDRERARTRARQALREITSPAR